MARILVVCFLDWLSLQLQQHRRQRATIFLSVSWIIFEVFEVSMTLYFSGSHQFTAIRWLWFPGQLHDDHRGRLHRAQSRTYYDHFDNGCGGSRKHNLRCPGHWIGCLRWETRWDNRNTTAGLDTGSTGNEIIAKSVEHGENKKRVEGNKVVTFLTQQGRVIGITVGCLLGMIPLIFMKDKKDKDAEKKSDEALIKPEIPAVK